MNISYEEIFPTRMWSVELAGLDGYYGKWIDEAHRLRDTSSEKRGKSNRLGWNSHAGLFKNPDFTPLFQQCAQAFNACLKSMSPEKELKYTLEAWLNIHDKDGYNTAHVHPGALLSGVFYLSVPEGAGMLVLKDPRPAVQLSQFIGDVHNGQRVVFFPPRPGMLVMFPNWLEHYVEPNDANGERISIPMNAQPV